MEHAGPTNTCNQLINICSPGLWNEEWKRSICPNNLWRSAGPQHPATRVPRDLQHSTLLFNRLASSRTHKPIAKQTEYFSLEIFGNLCYLDANTPTDITEHRVSINFLPDSSLCRLVWHCFGPFNKLLTKQFVLSDSSQALQYFSTHASKIYISISILSSSVFNPIYPLLKLNPKSKKKRWFPFSSSLEVQFKPNIRTCFAPSCHSWPTAI